MILKLVKNCVISPKYELCVCKPLKAVNDEHLNMFDSLELGKAVLYYVTHVDNENNYGVASLIMLIYIFLSCLQVFLNN